MSLEEALNPNTPAKRLEEILDLDNLEICQAIATNPNSSPEILKELFGRCAIEVLNNPALDLILLEIPNFFEQLLSKNYAVLYEQKNLPSFMLDIAVNHPDSNINRSLAMRPNLPGDYLEKLADKEAHGILQVIATQKNTPIHIVEKLAEDTDYTVRSSLALRRDLPNHILEKLANDEHYHVRSGITYNKNTPIHIVEKLAEDTDYNVRSSLVLRRDLPNHILAKLANDGNPEVRSRIAMNQKAPIHIVEKLAEDPDDEVRYPLALRRDLPMHILEKLATDKSPQVRFGAANNPNINPTIIKLVFEGENYAIHPDKSTELRYAIELEIMRLNWTKEQAIKCFKKKYNNRYFDSLNNEELLEFWEYLKSIESNNYPTSLRKDAVSLLDDYDRSGVATLTAYAIPTDWN